MNKDCGEECDEEHCVNKVTITDGIIAQRAWQIFLAEVDAHGMRFSQSEKDEIRNYIFTHAGLVSRLRLRGFAEGCIRTATDGIERDKLRRR